MLQVLTSLLNLYCHIIVISRDFLNKAFIPSTAQIQIGGSRNKGQSQYLGIFCSRSKSTCSKTMGFSDTSTGSFALVGTTSATSMASLVVETPALASSGISSSSCPAELP